MTSGSGGIRKGPGISKIKEAVTEKLATFGERAVAQLKGGNPIPAAGQGEAMTKTWLGGKASITEGKMPEIKIGDRKAAELLRQLNLDPKKIPKAKNPKIKEGAKEVIFVFLKESLNKAAKAQGVPKLSQDLYKKYANSDLLRALNHYGFEANLTLTNFLEDLAKEMVKQALDKEENTVKG